MAVALEFFVEGLPGGERRWEGDGDAFAHMYARCFNPLVSYCRRLVRDGAVAEELAQEAMLNAWSSWDRYSAARPFWPWVATIARRLCIDWSRHEACRTNRRHVEASVCERPDPQPDEVYERNDERELALEAVRQLRPGYQRILGLREIDGWSYEDIAKFEATTVESVRSSLRRARIALRHAYARVSAGAPAMLGLGFLRRLHRRLARAAVRMQTSAPASSPAALARVGDALTGLVAIALVASASGGAALTTRVDASRPAGSGSAVTSPAGDAGAAPTAPVAGATSHTTRAPSSGRAASLGLPLSGPEQPADADVTDVVASPSYQDDGTLFAVGSAHNGCSAGSCWALFRSTDRGTNWNRLSLLGAEGGHVLLPPAYPTDNRIFLASTSALKVSLDDGATFVPVTPLGGTAAMSPSFSAGDPRILVGAAPGWEFHSASGDDGTVTPLSYLPPPTGTMLTFAFAPGIGDNRLLAGGTFPDGPESTRSAVFLCTGADCLQSAVLAGSVGAPSVAVAPSFSEDGTAYAWIGSQLSKSTDAGRTFTPLALPGSGTIRQVAFAPDGAVLVATSSLEAANGAGLLRSIDGGVTWDRVGTSTPLARGAESVAATGDGRLLAGASASAGGGLWCSVDSGRSWQDRCAA